MLIMDLVLRILKVEDLWWWFGNLLVIVLIAWAILLMRNYARNQAARSKVASSPVLLASSRQIEITAKQEATDQKIESVGTSTVFSLVPATHSVEAFHVPEERLPWFDDLVSEINEVKRGINIGEECGDEVPSWQRGDFTLALRQLRSMVLAAGEPANTSAHEPLDDVALALRLIATDLQVTAAAALIEGYRSFRASNSGGGVLPTKEWIETGITLIPFEDRVGRPIVVIRPRYHRPGNIEMFRRGLRATMDCVKAHSLRKRGHTFSDGNPLEQYAMVFDFKGASLSNLDWEAFHVTIEEGARLYPNMGSQIYVLNVNMALRWVWAAARRFMHPRIRRKCFLVPSGNVSRCMQKIAPVDQLPPEYGGTGPVWPAPHEANTFEEQVGELAAATYRRAGVIPVGARPSRFEFDASPHAKQNHGEAGERRLSTCSGDVNYCGSGIFSCFVGRPRASSTHMKRLMGMQQGSRH